MAEKNSKKKLEIITFNIGCTQSSRGIQHNLGKGFVTEKIYIHQITIKRDINDRYEQLYSIKYDDYLFNETKFIENKTYSELVNFIDKQKIITEKKFIEYILSICINKKHADIVNGIEFVKKEKVDFEKENLPMMPI